MKTLLSLLLLVVPLSLRAANPSFGSFSTNDFDVQQPYIYLAHTQTGGTNIFINTTNIYVDSSVYYTNVTFSVTNSYISITNTTFVINGTNAAAINPTIGRIPYNANGSNFLDSALFHIDPTTAGVDNLNAGVVGVSNLVTGGVVYSVPDGGVGVLTNGPSLADICLWTNISSHLQPFDLTWQPLSQVGWLLGTNTETYWGGTLTDGESLVSFRDTTLGESVKNRIFVGAGDPSGDQTLIDIYTNSDTNAPRAEIAISVYGPTTSIINSHIEQNGDIKVDAYRDGVGMFLHPTRTDTVAPYQFDTVSYQSANAVAQFSNFSTNIISIGPGAQIGFGVGSSNVLSRIGASLVYTNDLAALRLISTGNYQAILTNRSDVVTIAPGGNSLGVGLLDSSANEIRFFGNSLIPLNSAAFGAAVSGELWGNAFFGSTIYDYGFLSGANYARGTISHTGTNGYWLFDSQGNGTAGAGRPIRMSKDGTAMFTFDVNVSNQSYITGNDGTAVYLTSSNLIPLTDNTVSLGGAGISSQWHNLGLKGTEYLYGFLSGTNQSNLALSHAGTNSSTGGVVFDSIGTGSAGTGRPQWFRVDGTNIFKIDYTVGASTTGLLIYENGTAQRVTVGANDSGGAGFRVLRIPN